MWPKLFVIIDEKCANVQTKGYLGISTILAQTIASMI